MILLQCTSGQKHARQSNYGDLIDAIKSSMSSSSSLLFVPQDHFKHSCLLLVLQNKQRQAELEQWLEKSTNPQQDMSAWASGLDQVLWKGWVNEVRGRRVNVMRGCWGAVGLEVWTPGRQSSHSQFSLPYPSWEHHFYFLFITRPISPQSFQTTVE